MACDVVELIDCVACIKKSKQQSLKSKQSGHREVHVHLCVIYNPCQKSNIYV